ncbi:O-antigen ligase family protein [Geobacter sp.]|uniref:O-antigen ligase family protein n=1 Tax=Geobacter sp. TaxID=46610 RepID=UPI0026395852|nr:O-antigen ligase family protein [Geobacter sp.]
MISSKDYFSVNVKAIWAQLRQEPLYFWLLCGYLFFEYVRPQSIYTPIDILPWAKLFVIGAAIGSFSSKKTVFSFDSLAKYYWGLVFAVLLSSMFAEFPGIAFTQFNVVLNWLIIYYLFIRIVTTKFRFFIVLLLIMLASFKMSQHAAISFARRGFVFERWGIAGGLGFLGNAADLGVQMLIILPLSIIFVKGCYSYWGTLKKVFFVFLPITVLITIVATGERNTLVGLAAICLVAPLTAKSRLRNIFLMAIFVIGLVAVMPQALLERFDTAGMDNTSQTRLTYWKQGIEFFKDHPILGIGYNNWVPYYQKYPSQESLLEKVGEVAHSTPITVLAELGVLGFIFYYGIVLKTIFINLRSMAISRSHMEHIWRDIPFALNIGLVGFLTASIFISVTFYPFLFIQASLSAALYNILLHESKDSMAKRLEV